LYHLINIINITLKTLHSILHTWRGTRIVEQREWKGTMLLNIGEVTIRGQTTNEHED